MDEQQLDIRKITGTPTAIDLKGEPYQGRLKYRVSMAITVNGVSNTMPLDVTMPKTDPNGRPPFEVGKPVEFEYTRKEWHPADDPEKSTMFYNHRWPMGQGGGGSGRQWVPQGPKITLRATTIPSTASERSYSVELSCSPTDDLGERAGQVNAALVAMMDPLRHAATKPATHPAAIADRIDETCPF